MIGLLRVRWFFPAVMTTLVASLVASSALGESFFPLPVFTDHAIPEAIHPPAADQTSEYVDLAVLVVGLILAAIFALVLRWRRGLLALAIGSVAWLGFVRQGCVCPIGAIQNVTLAMSDSAYHIPWLVVVLFVLPLVFTLFFGRAFCAAVCPLGAIQELVALFPIRIPRWIDHTLGLLAYVYLGAAVIFAAAGSLDTPIFVICRYDPFVGLFRMGATIPMLLLGGGFLLVGLFVGRPYCRFLCPYGALLGMLSKLSK